MVYFRRGRIRFTKGWLESFLRDKIVEARITSDPWPIILNFGIVT